MQSSEHKRHEDEAKQQQQTAAIHRKPGTLGEKLNGSTRGCSLLNKG